MASKIISKSTLILICSLWTGITSYAGPKVMPSCIAQLKEVYALERKFLSDIFTSGKAWHLKYSVSSVTLNPYNRKYEESISEGEVIASAGTRYKKANDVEIFIDKKDVFTVSNLSNTVMRTKSDTGALKIIDEVETSSIQDTILKMMKVTDCNITNVGNREVIVFNLQSDVLRCPYSRISTYVDPKSKAIVKIYIQMNLKFQKDVKEQTIIILKREEINVPDYLKNIKDKFLASNGQLKPKYAGYKLTDLTLPQYQSKRSANNVSKKGAKTN
jgi:hypothetical protein